MVHVFFLLLGLLVTWLEQIWLARLVSRLPNRTIRQLVYLTALALPVVVVSLFSLTMLGAVLTPPVTSGFGASGNGANLTPAALLPSVTTSHHMTSETSGKDIATLSLAHFEWLAGLVGFGLIATPFLLALAGGGLRLGTLYFYALRDSWAAPASWQSLLEEVAERAGFKLVSSYEAQKRAKTVELRICHAIRPFAFNLPALGWFRSTPTIIVSSGLVGLLSQVELEAVLWHELIHLKRRDAMTRWLADFSRLAFFYLPNGSRLARGLGEEQELECDATAGRLGGERVALALAEALVKVWQHTLAQPPITSHRSWWSVVTNASFKAPGLTSGETAETLTERRLTQLLELERNGSFSNQLKQPGPTPATQLDKTGGREWWSKWRSSGLGQTKRRLNDKLSGWAREGLPVLISLGLWLAGTGLLHLLCPQLD